MAKVFRLHKGAISTIEHWEKTNPIESKSIDTIIDPSGAASNREITSIPSPFARMELAKRAFKFVADHGLKGDTAYHKIVSDCLDVGQLFFNIEQFRGQGLIEIIKWDRQECLAQLDNSTDNAHSRLGRTYKTYLQQDGTEYNFEQMDSIYLLNYKGSNAPNLDLNIIGATSPATLFFSSANNLSYVGKNIAFGDHIPFDGTFTPLHERTVDYIKYWKALQSGTLSFSKRFPELDRYLTASFKAVSDATLKKELMDMDLDYYANSYPELSVDGNPQNHVRILDITLRRKGDITNLNSGFKIRSSNVVNGKKPLVLPVETFTNAVSYVDDTMWDSKTSVPFLDNNSLEERLLPKLGIKYPYLTVGDFLEERLIRMPYRLNSEMFFDGNVSELKDDYSYLLPLTKTFFEYFTVEDLMGQVNGLPFIEMKCKPAGSVEVILRIPIEEEKTGFVQYKRLYYAETIEASDNKGVVVELDFSLGIYPAVKYPEKVTPYYSVMLWNRDSYVDNKMNTFELDFYTNENQLVREPFKVWRNRTRDGGMIDKDDFDPMTYVFEENFRYIRFCDAQNSKLGGVIIPQLQCKDGGKKFSFAVDFGTTNTHIEYQEGNNPSKAFDVTEKDCQLCKMHIFTDNVMSLRFLSDCMSDEIGNGSAYCYPVRTVLAEGCATDWSCPVHPFAHTNIPYAYGKEKKLEYNDFYSDLKWSLKAEDRNRASKYIETMLMMMRAKVLLNGGDLNQTRIVWTYPVSMTTAQFNRFDEEWGNLTKKIFGEDCQVVPLSESVAPYQYFNMTKGAKGLVVSVDIGGGSTDVLISANGESKYLMSFRFATNAIFGDAYNHTAQDNGFVSKYTDVFRDMLENNDLGDLREILDEVSDGQRSPDIIAFFFSLISNKDLLDKKLIIDFNQMLSDDDRGKYVVVMFYVAIFYHIAKSMKDEGLERPQSVTFSGNGSKILKVLSSNDKTLESFTKEIFSKIYDQKSEKLTIVRLDEPKESTCKGAILCKDEVLDHREIRGLKKTLIGCEDEFSKKNEKLTYKDLPDDVLNSVVKEVQNFFTFFFELNVSFPFHDYFNTDPKLLDFVKELCGEEREIRTYLQLGIKTKQDEITLTNGDGKLDETLFFYPLVGIMNDIAREVYNYE